MNDDRRLALDLAVKNSPHAAPSEILELARKFHDFLTGRIDANPEFDANGNVIYRSSGP
jgi:hypothetical protein